MNRKTFWKFDVLLCFVFNVYSNSASQSFKGNELPKIKIVISNISGNIKSVPYFFFTFDKSKLKYPGCGCLCNSFAKNDMEENKNEKRGNQTKIAKKIKIEEEKNESLINIWSIFFQGYGNIENKFENKNETKAIEEFYEFCDVVNKKDVVQKIEFEKKNNKNELTSTLELEPIFLSKHGCYIIKIPLNVEKNGVVENELEENNQNAYIILKYSKQIGNKSDLYYYANIETGKCDRNGKISINSQKDPLSNNNNSNNENVFKFIF